jgi:hypothetical protein
MDYKKIWSSAYGTIPKDNQGKSYEIHHIDGNRENNDLINLMCISIQEHYDIHKQQGDYYAAWLIAQRMKITLEETFNLKKSLRGRVITQDTRDKMSKAQKGRVAILETKTRISKALTGKKRPEEVRRKISESKKGKPGRVQSEEVKEKIKKALVGRKRPQEVCSKIKESWKSRKINNSKTK